MSEITSHPDQTTKQPVFWFCLNEDCNTVGPGFFEFESDYPVCPKCGSEGEPTVQKRVLIHFLQFDPKGPIRGYMKRFRMSCDPKRVDLATLTNGEAATGEIQAVNCPGCLKALGLEVRQPN